MGEIVRNATKFTFDTEFQGRRDVPSDAAVARQRISLSHRDLEEMCAKAKAEGISDGQVRAAEKAAVAAERTTQAVEMCATAVRQAVAHCEADIETVRETAAHLAFAAARKLAGAAISALPSADVEQALRAAMHVAITEPRITVRTTREAAEVLTPRIETIAREEGFRAEVNVVADPAMAAGDARIEWPDAGVERRMQAIETAIEELIERRFAANGAAERAKG